METVFVRFEKKYVVTRAQRNHLISGFLKHGFTYDLYSPNGSTYSVYTIYYDTPDYAVIRQSLTRLSYKEKLRVRFYKYPLKENSLVFIELKKKLSGKGNKRRLPLTYREAIQLIDHHQKPTLTDMIDIQIFREIDFYLKNYTLVPFTFIKYDRLAMMDETTKIRVTFDDNIEYTRIASLENLTDFKSLPQSKDLIVMEIKSLTNYPLWLSNLLTEQKVYSRGFSKFRNTYETLHEGGMIHVTT